MVYSTFEVIDENNRLTPREKISSPILEILESHMQNPIEGNDIWIKMGTQIGIINITSSTSVSTNFAYQCPFPNEKASEDFSFVDEDVCIWGQFQVYFLNPN